MHPRLLVGGDSGLHAVVDIGLAHPGPNRLNPVTELLDLARRVVSSPYIGGSSTALNPRMARLIHRRMERMLRASSATPEGVHIFSHNGTLRTDSIRDLAHL